MIKKKMLVRIFSAITIVVALLSGPFTTSLGNSYYHTFGRPDLAYPFFGIIISVVWVGLFLFTFWRSGWDKFYLYLLAFSPFALWPFNMIIWGFIAFLLLAITGGNFA